MKEARSHGEERQPAGVRLGVWDTATAVSSPNNPLATSTGPSNRFNMPLPGDGDGINATPDSAAEQHRQPRRHLHAGNPRVTTTTAKKESVSSTSEGGDGEGCDPEKPYAYESLLENSATRLSPVSSTATTKSLYPKLVDRNGSAGGSLGGGSVGGSENRCFDGVERTSKTAATSGRAGADGLLAAAAERSLSVGGNAEGMAPDGNDGREEGC